MGGGGDVLLSVLREQEEGKPAPAGFYTQLFVSESASRFKLLPRLSTSPPPAYSVMIKVLGGFGLLLFLGVAADCEHKGCIKPFK